MIHPLYRITHALTLAVLTLAWIGKRALGLGLDHNYTINFSVCMSCGERFTVPGLIWCKRCLAQHQAEYAEEWEVREQQ